MDTQRIKGFLKDLFTLRTVWIDKGQGQWSVKKRMHPLLRGVLWTLALIVSLTVYAAMKNESLPEPEPAIAKTVELNEPEKLHVQTVAQNQTQEQTTVLPLQPIAMKRDLIFPSEMNPNTDKIMIPIMKTEVRETHEERTERRERPERTERTENPRMSDMPDDGKYRIFVRKSRYRLWLLRGNEIVHEYMIATGKNPGDKQRVGDNRTPTGNFKIVSIENASAWTHDFRDGKGKIKGAYGPWFLRLDAKGWKGIGIHGTHDPDSRGTNATEGCIRLSNEDIAELRQYAYRNMPVIIRER